jgi:general secretion pathway protein M
MKQAWQRISAREQRLLQVLGGLLLLVLVFTLIFQPTRKRLETVERQYQQQMGLAAQLQRAQPRSQTAVATDQPLSLRISESVTLAGLEIRQMESEGELLRLTLDGDAQTLMKWIDDVERDAVALQSLTLENREGVLQAQMVLR